MFDSNDHNRTGSKKEVKQCCNCLYNQHSANDLNYPCIICTNIEALRSTSITPLMKQQGFFYVAYTCYEDDENGELKETRDFKNQLTGFPLRCPLKED